MTEFFNSSDIVIEKEDKALILLSSLTRTTRCSSSL